MCVCVLSIEHRRLTKAWNLKLAFWCLNPAVVFELTASLARCILLTSGTLSPMETFASELGTEFPIRVEAMHIIDPHQVPIYAFPKHYRIYPPVSVFFFSVGLALFLLDHNIQFFRELSKQPTHLPIKTMWERLFWESSEKCHMVFSVLYRLIICLTSYNNAGI